MLSPVRLSVVCNVRAPYSAGWNFRQCFYAIWYLGHLLSSVKFFTEIVPGEPLRRGRSTQELWPNIAIWDLSTAISRKRCKTGGKLVLITNLKSYMSFRLVPDSFNIQRSHTEALVSKNNFKLNRAKSNELTFGARDKRSHPSQPLPPC